MKNQEVFRSILSDQLRAAKQRNPSFSMRAFSRKAGLSSSAVSEILAGKRKVSRRLALRVLGSLQQDAQVIASVMAAFDQAKVGRTSLVLRVDKDNLKEAKAVLSKFFEEFKRFGTTQVAGEAYQLSLTLVPVGELRENPPDGAFNCQ